jgi:REP element-mobilizing transposase RayT
MRRPKLEAIGWHVFARGTRRLQLFHDDEDYLQFTIFLKHALSTSGCVLWAFVLMSNHYHLVLYGSSSQLTACMQVLNRLYAKHHNRKYDFAGHCFDGPYQAYPQPSPLLLLRTVSYVFLNPVDAGLSTAPELYPWSCFRSYSDGQRDGLIDVDPAGLMAHVSNDPKSAWRLFYRAMEREARRPKFRNPAKLTMVQVHAQQFEWLLEHARDRAAALGGEDPEFVAMYWASTYGISPRAVAKALRISDIADVSRRIYRFKKRLEGNPGLRELMSPP